ncbi:urease accessory protein UreF [Schizosaccharomyces cryophilus OY26]|uniref:Urease accessory protein UreF n=1 Tax=Schizosaccharomyces cryophilus (strain OY26 / ATCC MYA-4695 / CBS 11777 / NBRC 106824 / NRRL Y48691) TaxID=653667 RepID=S9VVR8_SCHCR|nr:urease accessory protein UreF [Schizosaccharomyces cryophilus OY26]EPY50235.1 urease accessory protein UreF [Schizosaccharomyces cryophilus OY26]
MTTEASENHLSFILSDAAFPLSSFSYSFGLESYLSHQPQRTTSAFFDFLPLSLNSLLYTNMPTVKETWENPEDYRNKETFFESTQTCTIGQKVSTMQGKALLGVWTKSFSAYVASNKEAKLLTDYDYLVRHGKALGHFPVVWGMLCRTLGISLERTCYLYLLNHAKSICSAAVRLDVLSSFQYVSTLVHPQTETLLQESLNIQPNLGIH